MGELKNQDKILTLLENVKKRRKESNNASTSAPIYVVYERDLVMKADNLNPEDGYFLDINENEEDSYIIRRKNKKEDLEYFFKKELEYLNSGEVDEEYLRYVNTEYQNFLQNGDSYCIEDFSNNCGEKFDIVLTPFVYQKRMVSIHLSEEAANNFIEMRKNKLYMPFVYVHSLIYSYQDGDLGELIKLIDN